MRVEKKIPLTNIILFFVTFITTLLAGAFQQGVNPFTNPLDLSKGIPFSFTLMAILLIHELGHYFYARKYKVKVTLPYFIPGPALPPPFFSVGTFGAFIKMKSPIREKNALFDIGAAGPLLGFVFSTIAIIIGLYLSEVQEIEITQGLMFGESLLIKFLVKLILGVSSKDVTIFLHPIGLAGWFGYFITFINLIPVGQLDGGHIFYAVFGKWHRFFTRIFFILLIVFGIIGWNGWFFWAFLLMLIGVHHPPIADDDSSLSFLRKLIAVLLLIIFILIFMLNPFSFNL